MSHLIDPSPFMDSARAALSRFAEGVSAWLRLPYILLVYLGVLTLAEVLTTFTTTASLGLAIHGLVLMALLLQAGLMMHRYDQRMALALAFAPLIRLVSLSLPLQDVPVMYWYAITGAPLILSAWLVMRYAGFSRGQVGLTVRSWPVQLFFSILGVGLGYLEYLILRPQPLVPAISLEALWLPALILIVFTGFLEELIFRGLMQSAFVQGLGRWYGLLYGSLLFAMLHLGYKSALDVLFVFGVACLFGLFVLRTGSILGVTLAHGLTNITLFLIFPFLIGLPAVPPRHSGLSVPTPIPTRLARLPDLSPQTVDDGDPGFMRSGGESWQAEQGMGGDLVWVLNSRDQATMAAVWTLSVEACGLYQVEAYIPSDYATTRSLPYEVLHRDGAQSLVVDQYAARGIWTALGRFWFEPSQPARVSAANSTGEPDTTTLIVFDAVRWTLVEECAR